MPTCLSNTFNGISKSFVDYAIYVLDIDRSLKITTPILENLYQYIYDIIHDTNCSHLGFAIVKDANGKRKDYALTKKETNEPFSLNFLIAL